VETYFKFIKKTAKIVRLNALFSTLLVGKERRKTLNSTVRISSRNLMLSVSSRIQYLCFTIGPKLSVYRILGYSGAIVSRILLFNTTVPHRVSRRVVRLSVDYAPPTAVT